MKKALIWLLAIIGLFIIVGFLLPNKVVVERKATINARIERVQAILCDLATYDKWMTYNQKDPNWKKEISTPSSGPGASYSWKSDNSSLGIGKMTLVKCTADEVACVMEFGTHVTAEGKWQLMEMKGDKTEITWTMTSEMGANPIARYMGLIMDMRVGLEFEKSLQQLNTLAKGK